MVKSPPGKHAFCVSTAAPDPRNQVLRIDWPDSSSGRARVVVTRSTCRRTGKHPSWKLGRSAHYGSDPERHAFILLNAHAAVRWYQEQPATIYYLLDGVQHRHFPDILVDFGTRLEFWEVKPADKASDLFVQARTELMRKELPRFGFGYRLALAEDLAQHGRLKAALLLADFGRGAVTPIQREHARRFFGGISSISWGDVRCGMLPPLTREVVARLTLEGDLACDWSVPITDATEFRWVGRHESLERVARAPTISAFR